MAQLLSNQPPAPDLPPELRVLLGRRDREPAGQAIMNAKRVLTALRRADLVGLFGPHVGVSRDGDVTITFCHDRKLASYQCDSEGDVIFMLSDRGSDSVPWTEVLNLNQLGPSIQQAHAFLI